jgi:hypothetical protein
MSVADVSVVLAAAAFAVSLSTFLINRRRDRRDLFLRLHERLASVDQQRGRKLIHERLRRQHKLVEDLGDDYEAINNALAMLNVACFYYARRYISRKDWLETWSVPIVRAIDAAEPFLAYRDAQVGGARTWPELRQFAADARKYLQRHGREAELADHPVTESLPGSAD